MQGTLHEYLFAQLKEKHFFVELYKKQKEDAERRASELEVEIARLKGVQHDTTGANDRS